MCAIWWPASSATQSSTEPPLKGTKRSKLEFDDRFDKSCEEKNEQLLIPEHLFFTQRWSCSASPRTSSKKKWLPPLNWSYNQTRKSLYETLKVFNWNFLLHISNPLLPNEVIPLSYRSCVCMCVCVFVFVCVCKSELKKTLLRLSHRSWSRTQKYRTSPGLPDFICFKQRRRSLSDDSPAIAQKNSNISQRVTKW